MGIILWAIWLSGLTRVCLGRFVVEKNTVRVMSSNWMKDEYECAIGNFRVPQYDGINHGRNRGLSVCESEDVETNECFDNSGGCWEDKKANMACKDTFRGNVCECPVMEDVRFTGDGYTHREDIDECKDKLKCQCPECKCKNNWGGYECSCNQGLWYMQEHDICISNLGGSGVGWGLVWLILLVLCATGFGAYAMYKYRIKSYMDPEIRAIMFQYMPLDSQVEISNQIVLVDV